MSIQKGSGTQTAFHIIWIIVGIVLLVFLFIMIYVALQLPDLLSGLSGLGDLELPDFGGINVQMVL